MMNKNIFSFFLISFACCTSARPIEIDNKIDLICGLQGSTKGAGDLGKAYQKYLRKMNGEAGIPYAGTNAETCKNQVGANYDQIQEQKKKQN